MNLNPETAAPLAIPMAPVVTATGAPPTFLTIDAILAAPDVKEDVVDVPEWGGRVKVRGLTKAKQQELREAATVNGELQQSKLELGMIAACMAEPQVTMDQTEQLRAKLAGPVDRILQAILTVSGLQPKAVKEAERVFRP